MLRTAGFEVRDVREIGLRGHSDQAVFEAAQAQGLVLVTGDLDFSNTLRFPLGKHHGVFIARFPSGVSTQTLNDAILSAAQTLKDEETSGAVVIIEPSRIRLRRG